MEESQLKNNNPVDNQIPGTGDPYMNKGHFTKIYLFQANLAKRDDATRDLLEAMNSITGPAIALVQEPYVL